jgi:hypothetical protein
VLNPSQEIVGKIFVENFRVRVDAGSVLAYALEVLE